MLVASALAGLAMASTASAALAITYPYSGATWFTNSSVVLNFTGGEADPQHWSVLLTNEDAALLSGPQQILQQLNQTNGFVEIRLPQVQEGDGYKVLFANETNQTDIFAESQTFRIEHGQLPNKTQNSTTATTSQTSSSVHVPMGTAKPATSSGNPFATDAAKDSDKADSAAGAVAPAVAGAAAVAAAVFALL